jgi:hypothetical protein
MAGIAAYCERRPIIAAHRPACADQRLRHSVDGPPSFRCERVLGLLFGLVPGRGECRSRLRNSCGWSQPIATASLTMPVSVRAVRKRAAAPRRRRKA